MKKKPILIYHNPNCGTSRNTLAMIRHSGEEPKIIEYLKTPPSRKELIALLKSLKMTARDVLREKGTPYLDLGLDDPKITEEALVDAMVAHPVLINRPIVVTPKGTRLCRPSEVVLEILPHPLSCDFIKEDGTRVSAKNISLKKTPLKKFKSKPVKKK